MNTVWIVYGTRPEVIKMSPVVRAFQERSGEVQVLQVYTGQHRELASDLFEALGVAPDHSLDLMQPDQAPIELGTRAMVALDALAAEAPPDCVLVQGDTSTAFFAALVGFFHRATIGHVEAGLRSYRKYSPFPEEMMRRLADGVTDLHFAPTPGAAENLRREGFDESIHITGNTVVDAVRTSVGYAEEVAGGFATDWVATAGEYVVVTLHRRESFGEGMRRIMKAIADFAIAHPSVRFLYPVHPNPNLRDPVEKILRGVANVTLTDPIGYFDMVYLLSRCSAVLTDSGGIQEEGPALGKRVLVAREVTERPEGVEQGWATLVGSDPEAIRLALEAELKAEFFTAAGDGETPYGDGRAGSRIADLVIHALTGAPRRTKAWRGA